MIMATYEFKCRNIGMDCDFESKAKTVDDLMPKIKEHAASAHKITEIDEELQKKVTSAIKKKSFF
jgi:Predicted small metal-binding protein